MTDRCVALLRGINVGGKNRIAMADLRACFEAVGCSAVRTYIQSGNVVCEPGLLGADAIGDAVTEQLARRFDLRVPVLIRRADAFREAVTANPFLDEDVDPRHLSVGFLSSTPPASRVGTLDPERSPGDRFVVVGSEVYLHVPGGMARSKLTTPFFDERLDTTMTVRNLRTVDRLVEMLDED